MWIEVAEIFDEKIGFVSSTAGHWWAASMALPAKYDTAD
jgi:hypothetical protein